MPMGGPSQFGIALGAQMMSRRSRWAMAFYPTVGVAAIESWRGGAWRRDLTVSAARATGCEPSWAFLGVVGR
jgi:hypothetical protein